MDVGFQKLLESATQRTLHAHAFSRASSQASLVLTDLLSRYLFLLTSTCAKHAQHAGRTRLTIYDALKSVDELGFSLDDLGEYALTEGKELNRYALHSARRAEELNELRSQLMDGLRQDHDDAIPLQYAPYEDSGFVLSGEEDSDEALDDGETVRREIQKADDMGIDLPLADCSPHHKRYHATPPLLPPISNPSSPLRKRPRNSSWHPPDYIPQFLPPFPSSEITSTPEYALSPHSTQPLDLPSSQIDARDDKVPLPVTQPLTSSEASDILVQVPYSQSSLAGVSERHLPGPPPPPPLPRITRLPTPQTEPSLIAAYHYILTHPPPPTPPPSNPSRHRVAMALLSQIQSASRWNPADTLYASIGPCLPRVATISPSYPIAFGDNPSLDAKGKDGKDKDFKFPATHSRPVSAVERFAPLVSQQSSRIPDLAHHVLHPAVLTRTSRLQHPPVLYRGAKPLIYGPGVAAPWNTSTLPSLDTVPQTPITAKPKDAPSMNGKDEPAKPAIPDARIYATWDYESKDFRTPLTRNRTRMGSLVASGSGVITLPTAGRSKATK